ncbi:MAG: hypothetical protein ACKOUR_15245, partial [Planctomycetota bacterium]
MFHRRRFQPRLEPLELRSLFAADLLPSWSLTGTTTDLGPAATAVPATTANSVAGSPFTAADGVRDAAERAEGEATPQPKANDLVAFAKALAASGTVFYGAVWCTFCNQQRALFEDGANELPFVEVTNADRTLNSIGVEQNITQFPTWVFPDQSRATGLVSLSTLSQRANVPIPQNNLPSLAQIDDVT